MSRLLPWSLCASLALVVGCSPSTPAPDAPTLPALQIDAAPTGPSATAASTPPLPVVSSAAVAVSASIAASAPIAVESTPAPFASSAPALPAVTVSNIGMHIGGGPNDAATKEPIRLSVEPHFEAFRACAGLAEAPHAGDFGIDLKIGKEGGKAKVSQPRTAMKGASFRDCAVKVFEAIEFRKPRGGATVVSYSLRFTPSANR